MEMSRISKNLMYKFSIYTCINSVFIHPYLALFLYSSCSKQADVYLVVYLYPVILVDLFTL